MGFTQTVNGKLIFFAAVFFQAAANLVGQVEWIAEDGERNAVLLHQPQQFPEVRVQNRVAAGDVEIRQAVIDLAEVQAVIKGVLHLLPGHCIQLFIAVLGENVAVLAPLVTFIRDMPLKRKILFHRDPPCCGGTHFRKRNRRCTLGNTPQGFLGVYSLHLTACHWRHRQSRRQQASRRACQQRRKP